MIDFKELPQDGVRFEQLIREILIREGYETHWTGVGPDGRKDLVITENLIGNLSSYKRKWLISCKHFANAKKEHSVGIEDLGDISADCHAIGAEGFILACSTYPSSSAVARLEGVQTSQNIFTKFWDAIEIERRLLTPNCFSLIHTFFPVSSSNYKWNIYNTHSPSFWAAHYKDYFFYLSCRQSNTYPYLEGIETIINIFERIKIFKNDDLWWESHHLRVRAIYYDDKHSTHLVFLDYIYPIGFNVKDILTPKQLKAELSKAFTKDDHDVINSPDWDLKYIEAHTGGDSFQFDHKDYYEPYMINYERGSSRDGYDF